MINPDDQTLRWLLRHVERWMTDEKTTDFAMNRPREGWVKQNGLWFPVETPYTLSDLEEIGHHSAGLRGQDIWTNTPLCSTTSPWGHRVQLVQSPCVLSGTYSYSARKQGSWSPTVDNLVDRGTIRRLSRNEEERRRIAYIEPARLYREGDLAGFFKAAVRNRLKIMACGLMGSGKTTFIRALCNEIDPGLRVCSIEDEDEARLTQPNRVGLLYSEGGQGEANIGPEQLMIATLRMMVDWCVVQELRNASAWAFLRVAANLPCMTTNHGDSCYGAFDTTCLMLRTSMGGQGMDRIDMLRALNQYVDVVVHCVEAPANDNAGTERFVDEVWFRGVDAPLGITREQAEAA